jgi:hypothetical protein
VYSTCASPARAPQFGHDLIHQPGVLAVEEAVKLAPAPSRRQRQLDLQRFGHAPGRA